MNPQELEKQLAEIRQTVWLTSRNYQGDAHSLLSVLRTLESLHRDIRQQLFEPSLPDTRQALYTLLRDVEENGGWPYIERMKLLDCLRNLSASNAEEKPSSEMNQESVDKT